MRKSRTVSVILALSALTIATAQLAAIAAGSAGGMGAFFAAAAKARAALVAKVNRSYSTAKQEQIFYREVQIDRKADRSASEAVPHPTTFADNRKRALLRAKLITQLRQGLKSKYKATSDELNLIHDTGYAKNWPLPPSGK